MWIFSQSERIKTNLAQLPSKKVERIALQRWEEGGGRGVWKRGVGGGGVKLFTLPMRLCWGIIRAVRSDG